MSAAETVSEPATAAPSGYSFWHLMYWCVRRELWENRSLYVLPLIVAGLLSFVAAFPIIAPVFLPDGQQPQGFTVDIGGDSGDAFSLIAFGAAPGIVVGLLVVISYCLGALHSERQDRSILFWKSLPVSDLTTVLSKASIPIVVMPLIMFAAAVLTAIVAIPILALALALFSSVQGVKISVDWSGIPFGMIAVNLFYGLFAAVLWHAPIYAWFLLVSAWAKRMVFVWAVAPVGALAVSIIFYEQVAYRTQHVARALVYRVIGFIVTGFSTDQRIPKPTPGEFIAAPEFWIGLALAAVFLGGAVILRRYRQPM